MGLLDTLKNAVFEADPNAPAPAKTVTVQAGSIAAGSPVPMSSAVDPAFVAAIRKAVFGRNTALTQLMSTADKLASIIPDPSQRLKAAYATAGDGRTVKQIVDAVDVHLADVEGEELKFKAALEGKARNEVAPLEQQAQHLKDQVISSQQEIERAQQRIAELTANIGTITGAALAAEQEAVSKRQEFELMASNFKLAANAVRAELQQNRSVIMTALN